MSKIRFDVLKLQDRDLELLRCLFESRIMTAGHIAVLFFNNSREAAKKRLQKLKAAGLIGERKRKAYEPAVLSLAPKAFAVLREQGVLTEYPQLGTAALDKRIRVSPLTIQHELEVMDVKTAFHSVIKKTSEFSIAEFSTWPLLHQFEAFRSGYGGTEVLVKPDGFIRIHETQNDEKFEHTFFLELDRSSQTQDTLVARASAYVDFYKSGGFAIRNGAARSAFKDYPFRVLFIFKNAERRNNMAERLLQNNPPIFTQVILSTFDEVIGNPLGAIWTCPRDYREATKGTRFDIEKNHGKFSGYKRQAERELLVEQKVRKSRILTEATEA
jgi:hypothetical protein